MTAPGLARHSTTFLIGWGKQVIEAAGGFGQGDRLVKFIGENRLSPRISNELLNWIKERARAPAEAVVEGLSA